MFILCKILNLFSVKTNYIEVYKMLNISIVIFYLNIYRYFQSNEIKHKNYNKCKVDTTFIFYRIFIF